MDTIFDLRSAITVINFLSFLAIVWWAYRGMSRQRVEEAALLPFDRDDDAGITIEENKRG